jgi:hypothetical protein
MTFFHGDSRIERWNISEDERGLVSYICEVHVNGCNDLHRGINCSAATSDMEFRGIQEDANQTSSHNNMFLSVVFFM